MTEDLAALLENEDEDALFARIQEESLRHYREVELPRRALEEKNEDVCDTSDIFVAPNNISSRSDADQLFYEGTEAGANGFHLAAGSSYIYPSNYPVRDYQVNIVRSALFHNTLVSLPTGLGKTFIAAVVMYNYYRWFPQGKVVFMAPTRPLVSQQIRACHDIMAIPAEDTIEMTGTMNPNDRIQFWKTKRVFFLTPQVLANDLRNKVCPALQFKCVVVDEAHRATKEYAYCQVIRVLEESGAVFRVLALSATPGSNFKAVQEVVENLHIAKLEIRDEGCIDVSPYTHSKNIEPVIVKLTDHIDRVKEEFLSIFDRYVRNLKDARLVTGNVSNMTKFQLLKSSEKIKTRVPHGMTKQQVGYLMSDFAVSMSLAHALELLQTYGLQAFHHYLSSGDDDVKVKGAMTRLRQDPQLQELLHTVRGYLSSDNGEKVWSHPKLEHLVRVLQQHFSAAQDSGICSKVIIFCQYRVVVSEVYNILKTSEPLIRPVMFIGQSSGNGKGGLPQRKQLEVMRNFRNGETNVLIATCVAEEGLDIGAVDLIILMEAHRSPVRFVQRLGRTGRHRNGRCVVLLTSGKEVQKFNDAMATRKSYTRNILQNPNLVESLNENDPRMVPSHLRNPVQQLVHIRVRDDTTAGGKYKKQSDIRQAFNKKTTSKKSAEPATFLNSDQLEEIKNEFQSLELNFNTVPLVSNKYLWHRLTDCPMGCAELFLTTYNQLSEFNDWNDSLCPTCILSHSTDSAMLSDLLQLADKIRDKDPTRTDICTQFVRDTVKPNENVNKKRTKKNIKNNNETNKKKKQDKQVPSCSMDIRDCMAIASQKVTLSQDALLPKDGGNVVIDEPDVIDLLSENEEAIEIEDDILAYADKELYDAINHLHSLAQNSCSSLNIIDNRLLNEMSRLETECPKFLTSFDFPTIEDDNITFENIKNLNVENMFKPCIDSDLLFEEYKINTDELSNKFEVYSDSNDIFIPRHMNSYESTKKCECSNKVDETSSNTTKGTVLSVSEQTVCLEPKPEHEMFGDKCNQHKLQDSNRCSKIFVNDINTREQITSLLPTVNHSKQGSSLKFVENKDDNVQKEKISEIRKESEKYFEDDHIVNSEHITSPILSGKTTNFKNIKGFNQVKNNLSSVLSCETKKLKTQDRTGVNFNGKHVSNEKGKMSLILTSRMKNIRPSESCTEYSTSPVLSTRMPVHHNGSLNYLNKHTLSPDMSNITSIKTENSNTVQDSRIQNYESENSTSPILSGTSKYMKRHTLSKKNLFKNQNEIETDMVSDSCKAEDTLPYLNSSFVSNKPVTQHSVKSKLEFMNKFSNGIQRNPRSQSFLQLSDNVFKNNKTDSKLVSNLSEANSPEIVGIDDLFEGVDDGNDKLNKNIVSVDSVSKDSESHKNPVMEKSIVNNAECESEFVFNFDDLFDDDLDGNFSLPTAAAITKNIKNESNATANQNAKQEKTSCTSPIIVSKRINSQSTPRPGLNNFFSRSKLQHHSSKKLPIVESGSETESDILESPILKVLQETKNGEARYSTPVRNVQFHSQKPEQRSKHIAQQHPHSRKGTSTPITKQVEHVDYFELEGGDEDNWTFSQLFDGNNTKEKEDDDSMYTISQLVAKSSGLPTPEPSKQQEESGSEVHTTLLAKQQEENVCTSKSDKTHSADNKITDNIMNGKLSFSGNRENKSYKNSVASRHSIIFQFDSDDDLFEGIDSNLLSKSGAMNLTRNQENVNRITKIDTFENNYFNGHVKKKETLENQSILCKENNEKENIHSRKNISFSKSIANGSRLESTINKVCAEYNSVNIDKNFWHGTPLEHYDNFISHVRTKSPLKNLNIVGKYSSFCETKPVLSSGWITTKSVSALKRARPDDFTSDDSDAGSVFISVPKNGRIKETARNVKKKIKKCPTDANIVNIANEFVEREAEVSINRTYSSDEENTSGLDDLDESFIDDLTQRPMTAPDQSSVNMHAKYLQSIKSPVRGRYKIPVLSDTALQMDVYSQVVEKDDGSYMNDSFCVDETEVSDEAEPSVLEIAEQILEDRRKGKKRRKRILKYSSSSDSECEEDVHLKNSVKKNESTCSNEQSLIVNRKRKRRVCAVLSDSESDIEIVNHKHVTNDSNLICNKNVSTNNKISGDVSDGSSAYSGNKSSELFYKPTLSNLLKSKLKC